MINSAHEFRRLRTSSDPTDYERAANDEAPMAVWRAIIANMPEMKEWVAHNKTVPIEILETLARDLNASVRAAVAMKRKLPENLMIELSHDTEAEVRQRIAYNAKATAKVLELLAHDQNELVRERAAKRLSEENHTPSIP